MPISRLSSPPSYINPDGTIDRTCLAYKQTYGNFDLFLESMDDLFADDDISTETGGIDEPPYINSITTESVTKKVTSGDQFVSPVENDLAKLVGIGFEEILHDLPMPNHSFDQKILSMLPETTHLEEFQSIAILMHRIVVLNMKRSLWTVYEKLNRGEHEIITSETKQLGIKIWPPKIELFVRRAEMKETDNQHDLRLHLMNTGLCRLEQKSEQYRHELRLKTTCVPDYAQTVECFIGEFIEQELQFQRIEFDCQSALVPYHYTDRLLKHQYLLQNPNENQIHWMKVSCKLKYDQEMSKHELNLLRQRIPLYLNYDRRSTQYPSFIHCINDNYMRQQLFTEYKNLTEQIRTNLMAIHVECAKAYIQQCNKQFNVEMDEIWKVNKSLPSNQKLTPIMRNLMDQRLENIRACLQCTYKFKTQLAYVTSNMNEL